MKNSGFSILEAAIVLLIIALIIGSITIGNDLIRNSEIQSMYSESQRYITAVKNFKDKYDALPGDFSNAAAILNATNGNGDGMTINAEEFQAWVHLVNAKLIEGDFTGAAGSKGALDRVPGTNVPSSQFSGAGWGFTYVAYNDANIVYTTGDILPNHVLWFGKASATGTTNEMATVLSPPEADQVDIKIDDGFPGTGKVVVQINTAVAACHNTAIAYNLMIRGLYCALVFKTGF